MSRVISWVAALSLLSCTPIEPEKGYGYLCSRESGPADQCPGDFHCGLEGRCLKNQPGTYQCDSDIDCYGWHCGVAKRCYDLADAGAVECSSDEDCNTPGYWRCSPDRRCTDTTLERMPVATKVAGTVSAPIAALWSGSPTHVEEGHGVIHLEDGGVCSARSFVVASDGHVATLQIGAATVPCLGEWRAELRREPLPAEIAMLGVAPVVLRADGGSSVWWSGFGSPASPLPMVDVRGLRDDRDALVVFGERDVVRLLSDAGFTAMQFSLDASIVDVSYGGFSTGRVIYLLEGDGRISTAPELADGGVGALREAVLDYYGVCSPSAVRRLQVDAVNETLLVHRAYPNGTVSQAYRLGEFVPSPGCQLTDGQSRVWAGAASAGSPECVSAPVMQLQEDGGWYEHCLGKDGGLWSYDALPRTSPLMTARSRMISRALYAGEFPNLLADFGLLPLAPVMLDRPPSAFVRIDEKLMGIIATGDGAARGSLGAVFSRGLAPTYSIGSFDSVASVRGRPDLIAGGNAEYGIFVTSISSARGFANEVRVPELSRVDAAAAARTRDGTSILLVATDDALFHARLLDDGGTATVSPIGKPLPGLRISAVAMSPDGLGAGYAGGYLVAGGRLIRFVADNPVVWRTSELLVGDEEVLDVWVESGRGRAGFADGTVVSLPSRVRVAPPIGSRVTAYAPVCERLFAVSETGLHQLIVTEGVSEGSWELLEARSGGGAATFNHGKLTVVWSDGSYGELPVPDCAD